MTWVELQEKIKIIFEDTHMHRFKAVVEKDKNGWNWILNFHKLTNDSTLIIHTRLIFKLDDSQTNLRSLEFLYLYDLNCKYKLVKFANLDDLESKINGIFSENKFGQNILVLSDLMVSPEQSINKYFYENKIEGYSVYEFDYHPEFVVIPCQKLSMDFKFNVNNKNDVTLDLRKENSQKFKLTFKHLDKSEVIELDDLSSLVKTIGLYIERNISL
jgi:hypothetical protein